MANWVKITEDKKSGKITAFVKVGCVVIPIVAYNWQWLLNFLSTVFGIK